MKQNETNKKEDNPAQDKCVCVSETSPVQKKNCTKSSLEGFEGDELVFSWVTQSLIEFF